VLFPGEEYLVPIVLGLCGWLVCSRLRVPVAGILGPLIFIGAAAGLGLPVGNFPLWIKTVLQIVVGVYAGSRVTRETFRQVRSLGLTIALVTAWTVLSAVGIGYLASRLTQIGLATALLGSSPGGTAEMSAMALTVGANVPTVAVLHSFRLVATLGLVPFLAKRRLSNGPGLAAVAGGSGGMVSAFLEEPDDRQQPSRPIEWLGTLALGAAGGLLFIALGIPGGGVVGSLLAVSAAVAVLGDVGKPPLAVRSVAQLGVGVLVGGSLTPQALQTLVGSLPVVVCITGATLASGLGLARFVEDRIGSGPGTALLACAPGGLSQMPIVADAMGADMSKVTIFQLTRFLCSIVVLPVLFRLLL
jgi:uncharacterized protein